MTLERSPAAMPAEPPAPPAAHPDGVTGETAPALRLQILSTEHWSLLATRSLAWTEAFTRAGMYLTILSGAIVALALVGQGSGFGEPFAIFAIAILPVVLFVGVTTFVRLGAANSTDATCIVGMNRIRAAYLELAPDLERYFVMSAHDDAAGVGQTMGVLGGHLSALHLFAATPSLVATVNSVVLAALVALVAIQAQVGGLVPLLAGAVAFVASVAAYMAYGRRVVMRGQAGLRPIFPSPPGAQPPGATAR